MQSFLTAPPPRPRPLNGGRYATAGGAVAILTMLLVAIVSPVALAASVPQLAASPASAAPGTAITVKGSGFSKNAKGVVILDGASSGPAFRANWKGAMSVSLIIPIGTAAGSHTVSAKTAVGGTLATTVITVVSAKAPTATPAPTAPPAPTATVAPTPGPTTSLTPTTQTGPTVNGICGGRFAISQGGSSLSLPYCSNVSITQTNELIRRVVIVIHGDSRNAPDHLRYIVDAAAASGASDALVIAPQFLISGDLTAANLPSSILYWSSSGWKQGDKSATSPSSRPWSVSSFAALDLLAQKVANLTTFPNVREIVVVGHSAGGQLVDRFAAANQIEPALAAKGIAVRYVVANPSSYLYFDANRYHSTTGTFAALSSSEQAACSSFDSYKYGLRSLNAYAGAVGASVLKAQYGARRVVYLLGLLDTSRTDSSVDQSCAAQWQGSQRLERGQTHFKYLAGVFGPAVYQNHLLRTVSGVGHDARAMYGSVNGLWAVFGAIT